MKTNQKVMWIVLFVLGGFSILTILNVWINFRTFATTTSIDKAQSIAHSVRDGLTAHMDLGATDKIDLFIDNMKEHQNVIELRVLRSGSLIKEYGIGEMPLDRYDDIDKKVLQTGKSVTQLKEDTTKAVMRVTIPYIAYSNSKPDCMKCHTSVKDGDVLGAITLEIDIADFRMTGVSTITKVIVITITFLIVAIFLTGHYIKPYIKLFDDLENGISRAYRGDFSYKVDTKLQNEAGEVARRLNELSAIFRFKKTIELDDTKDTIYKRVEYILLNTFNIKSFVLYENNNNTKKRKVAIITDDLKDDEKLRNSDAMKCRSFRTGIDVSSSDFHDICELCSKENKDFVSLPFSISEEYSLTLLLYTDKGNIAELKSMVPVISNYLALAEPVLETKFLMQQLHEKSLKDGLTNLYNRRFLDQFIETNLRDDSKYATMMIDIDFFKQVNDNYGHDVGDTVIKGLSEVLHSNIKGSDLAIRYGGEEFIVMLFNASESVAIKIANEIKKDFSKKLFKAGDKSFNKTLSLGISMYPEDSNSHWQSIKFADVALYNAKNTGRDKIVRFEQSMYEEEEI